MEGAREVSEDGKLRRCRRSITRGRERSGDKTAEGEGLEEERREEWRFRDGKSAEVKWRSVGTSIGGGLDGGREGKR